jgi:hypothetical protein
MRCGISIQPMSQMGHARTTSLAVVCPLPPGADMENKLRNSAAQVSTPAGQPHRED